jgi:hypothetical protein
MERRWGNRVVLEESVRVRRDAEVVGVALLCDVSLSGGFVRTHLQLPPMARVCIELHDEAEAHSGSRALQHFADTARPECSIDAFVVRRTESGLALEWCDLAPIGVLKLLERHHRPFDLSRRRAGISGTR